MRMLKNKISKFSTLSPLKGKDKNKLSNDVESKLSSLEEERDLLENDLSLIKNAIRAASKASTNETATEEEKESFEELKNNYSSFFDSDEEDEQNNVSVLTKVTTVKRYIKNEIIANEKSIHNLLKQVEKVPTSNVETSANTLQESSKKESSIENSFEEVVYNPFDDVGTD